MIVVAPPTVGRADRERHLPTIGGDNIKAGKNDYEARLIVLLNKKAFCKLQKAFIMIKNSYYLLLYFCIASASISTERIRSSFLST